MAYDEGVAERLGEVFENIPFSSEKKMFGSLGFMVHGHMACGVINEQLMVSCWKGKLSGRIEKTFCQRNGLYR